MTGDDRAAAMARKYVWWQPPERTLQDRPLLLAQMMTLATADDARWLVSQVSADELRAVLRTPPVGVLNCRSWVFWRRRLGLDQRRPSPLDVCRPGSASSQRRHLDPGLRPATPTRPGHARACRL